MAIDITFLNNKTSGTASITSLNTSPVGDSLVVVGINFERGKTNTNTPVVSGLGVTWTLAGVSDNLLGYPDADYRERMYVYYAQMPSSPGTGNIIASMSGVVRLIWMKVLQVTGHRVATPIAQIKAYASSVGQTSFTATFTNSEQDSGSRALMFVMAFGGADPGPLAGWQDLLPSNNLDAYWYSSAWSTTYGGLLVSGSSGWFHAIGLEVASAPPATPAALGDDTGSIIEDSFTIEETFYPALDDGGTFTDDMVAGEVAPFEVTITEDIGAFDDTLIIDQIVTLPPWTDTGTFLDDDIDIELPSIEPVTDTGVIEDIFRVGNINVVLPPSPGGFRITSAGLTGRAASGFTVYGYSTLVPNAVLIDNIVFYEEFTTDMGGFQVSLVDTGVFYDNLSIVPIAPPPSLPGLIVYA